MTHIGYIWSLGPTSCVEKGVIYQAEAEDKTIISRKVHAK